MDLIEILIIMVALWVVLQIVLGVFDGLNIVRGKEREELIKEISERIHQVNVETHGETDYWFDAENDQFLGQGKTLDEVVLHIKSRFPEHIFLLSKGGIAAETEWKLLPHDEFKKIVISKV